MTLYNNNNNTTKEKNFQKQASSFVGIRRIRIWNLSLCIEKVLDMKVYVNAIIYFFKKLSMSEKIGRQYSGFYY